MNCASEIAAKMFVNPRLNDGSKTTRVIVEPLRNKSSYRVNTGMVTNALKNELANIADTNGRSFIRFISNNESTKGKSNDIMKRKLEKNRDRMLDEIADGVLASPVVTQATKPVIIAVTPAINCNLVNLNANSFVSMLRAKIAAKANGRVQFTAPGSSQNADYYLTGEFISESMKNEGMVNLVNYIKVMEDRIKAGKSLDLASDARAISGTATIEVDGSIVKVDGVSYSSTEYNLLKEISHKASLREEPDVNKHLNVMLIRAQDKISVYENMFMLDRKSNDALDTVDMILSGDISSISRRAQGTEEVYLVITFVLTDAETLEEIWTGQYQTKKAVKMGGVYQ